MVSPDTESINLLDSTTLDEVSRKGQEWYATLKSELEPSHNGKTVAIHLETGKYRIGDSSPEAMRLLRHQFPAGLMTTVIIGPDQMDQFAYRLLGSHQQAKTQK